MGLRSKDQFLTCHRYCKITSVCIGKVGVIDECRLCKSIQRALAQHGCSKEILDTSRTFGNHTVHGCNSSVRNISRSLRVVLRYLPEHVQC